MKLRDLFEVCLSAVCLEEASWSCVDLDLFDEAPGGSVGRCHTGSILDSVTSSSRARLLLIQVDVSHKGCDRTRGGGMAWSGHR